MSRPSRGAQPQCTRGPADHFETNPRPLRIFLRRNPYRGMSGSAMPDCFVAGWHEDAVDQPDRLTAFVDHELVHNWVGLTGTDAVWFNEGLADYYSMVLPHRLGLLQTETFLERADEITRRCLASKWHDTPLNEVALDYWSDPRAHDVAYVRGVLYVAELDRVLRVQGGIQLDDLLKRVHDHFAQGSPGNITDWMRWVREVLGPVSVALHANVLDGSGPAPEGDLWQTGRDPAMVEVPVVEPGFAFSTFLTRVVTGLTLDGPAAEAGLREGDELMDLPRYGELLGWPANRSLTLTVRRGTQLTKHTMALGPQAVSVPQWSHAARHAPLPTVR